MTTEFWQKIIRRYNLCTQDVLIAKLMAFIAWEASK
jgi:hypothetical protein